MQHIENMGNDSLKTLGIVASWLNDLFIQYKKTVYAFCHLTPACLILDYDANLSHLF